MYQLIAFDIDGTLIDSKYSICKGLQTLILKNLNKMYSLDELAFAFGSDGADTLKQFGSDKTYLTPWFEEINQLNDTIHPYNGIIQLLENLKAKKISLAIISSNRNLKSHIITLFSSLFFMS